MRLCQRLLVFLYVFVLLFGLAAAPALAGITIQLNSDSNGIVYEGTPITIKATVYDDGTLVTSPAVEWSLGNPGCGTLSAVYGEAVTFTPARPSGLGRWDSVTTVVYAAYGGSTAGLSLTTYPGAAASNPLARAKVYLRAQQAADGKLTDDWAAIALAAAGENLSANDWLKNGRGHLEAMGSAVAGWDPDSTSTTTIARTLLAAAAARKAGAAADPRNFGGKDLVALLLQRQDASSGHFGLPGEAAWVNAHAWAVLALSSAGEAVPNRDRARQWLIDAQNADGGWGWTTDRNDPWGGYLSDSNDTAAAVRALVVLGAADKSAGQPLGKALSFLKTMQADDGGFFYGQWGPPSDSSSDAEVIQALVAAGEDPQGAGWSKTGGLNAVNHLLGLQKADGAFRWQAGSDGYSPGHDTAVALLGLVCLDPAKLPEVPPAPPGGGAGGGNPEAVTVTAEVRGLDGMTMYPARPVSLKSGKQTPLGALEALGASIETGFGGSYVVSIDGLAEKQYGQASGWIYLVNGSAPPAACNAYRLRDGDDVLWRYVRSLAETGDFLPNRLPVGPTLSPTLAGGIAAAEKALSAAKDGGPATTVLPSAPPDAAAAAELARALAANRVGLAQEVNPETETLVADELLEAGLKIPAGALERTVTISVREQKREEEGLPAPVGKTFASGVYDFGPDGQAFRKAATVYLRCLPSEGRAAADLTLAWFDPQSNLWRPLAAVYDPATGLLAGRITHFTRFAALTPAGPSPAFTDIDAGGKAWYAGAVKDLAARGVIGADEGPAFRPGDPVTRAVFTGWLARGLELLPGPAPSFTDLGVDAAYRAEIGAAARRGLVRGLPGGLFGPEKPLTRQELAAILVRAAHRAGQPEQLPPGRAEAVLGRYTDADQVAGWARTAVAAAVNEGLLVGTPDKHLNPRGPVTRAEAAAFVQRLVERERAVRDAA